MSEPMPDDEVVLVSPTSGSGLFERLRRLQDVRAEIDLLKEEAGQITYELEQSVARAALFTDEQGVNWRATVVRPDDTINVNLDVVAAMRPELYQRITTTALDRTALNKALRAGLIDPEVAKAAMTLRPNSPSIRLTRVEETEQESDERA